MGKIKSEVVTQKLRELFRDNHELVADELRKMGYAVIPPRGGAAMIIRINGVQCSGRDGPDCCWNYMLYSGYPPDCEAQGRRTATAMWRRIKARGPR